MHPFPRWLLRFNAALFLGPSPVVIDAQIVSVKDVFHQDAFVLKNLLVAYQAKWNLASVTNSLGSGALDLRDPFSSLWGPFLCSSR